MYVGNTDAHEYRGPRAWPGQFYVIANTKFSKKIKKNFFWTRLDFGSPLYLVSHNLVPVTANNHLNSNPSILKTANNVFVRHAQMRKTVNNEQVIFTLLFFSVRSSSKNSRLSIIRPLGPNLSTSSGVSSGGSQPDDSSSADCPDCSPQPQPQPQPQALPQPPPLTLGQHGPQRLRHLKHKKELHKMNSAPGNLAFAAQRFACAQVSKDAYSEGLFFFIFFFGWLGWPLSLSSVGEHMLTGMGLGRGRDCWSLTVLVTCKPHNVRVYRLYFFLVNLLITLLKLTT